MDALISLSSVNISLDGSKVKTCSSASCNYTATLSTGSHSYTANVSDSNGDLGSTTGSFTIAGNGPLACGTLSTPNKVYTLTQNVASSGTCFTVAAAGVTIDCNGHSITGSNYVETYGIYSDQSGTTIQNCKISNFQDGIFFNGVTGGAITNTNSATTQGTGIGILLSSSSGNTISGSTGTSPQYSGIELYSGSNYNTITGSTGTSTSGDGIEIIDNSNDNTIISSTGTSVSGNGIGLANSFYNNIISSTGTSNSFNGIYLDSGASNNMITGSTGTSNSNVGIQLYSSSNYNTITGSTGTSASYYGISVDSSSYNTISDSTFSTGDFSIDIDHSSNGNQFIRNTLSSGTYGTITLSSSSGNVFTLNDFTTDASIYIQDLTGSSNSYSTAVGGTNQGNIYPDVMSGAVPITGTTTSSVSGLYVGSAGAGYPYSLANGGKVSSNVVDSAPLTPTKTQAAPITIACPTATTGAVGSAYNSSAVASGGSGIYTSYSKASGSLPSGLSLNASTGAIKGTPSARGTKTFTVGVQDSAGHSATSDTCSICVGVLTNVGTCSSSGSETCTLANGCDVQGCTSTGTCSAATNACWGPIQEGGTHLDYCAQLTSSVDCAQACFSSGWGTCLSYVCANDAVECQWTPTTCSGTPVCSSITKDVVCEAVGCDYTVSASITGCDIE